MTDATEPATTDPPRASGSWTRRLLACSLGATLALLLVRALVVEVLVVSGASMEPGLREQDRVVVLKVSEPERGDLVVFRNPLDPSQNVIKRVIALSGQRVELRAGTLLVDGHETPEAYLGHASDHDGGINYEATTISDGYLFVLGDNRAVSSDSRRFGAVDRRLIIGKAVLALWPLRRL